MRRALSLGIPPVHRASPERLPALLSPLQLAVPRIPAPDRMTLASPSRRRTRSPDTEMEDQDDPEYVPSGQKHRTRGMSKHNLRRGISIPQIEQQQQQHQQPRSRPEPSSIAGVSQVLPTCHSALLELCTHALPGLIGKGFPKL